MRNYNFNCECGFANRKHSCNDISVVHLHIIITFSTSSSFTPPLAELICVLGVRSNCEFLLRFPFVHFLCWFWFFNIQPGNKNIVIFNLFIAKNHHHRQHYDHHPPEEGGQRKTIIFGVVSVLCARQRMNEWMYESNEWKSPPKKAKDGMHHLVLLLLFLKGRKERCRRSKNIIIILIICSDIRTIRNPIQHNK